MEEIKDLFKVIGVEKLGIPEVENFASVAIDAIKLYSKKNHDYGDSFNKEMDAIGNSYGIGRLYDKINRIITLFKVKSEIINEAIENTVRDLAYYVVMTSCFLNLAKKSIKFNGKVTYVNFE